MALESLHSESDAIAIEMTHGELLLVIWPRNNGK